ncbi:MAG: transketolase [Candidatus Vogelbacteria bacterium]|nr:transketolase [Candidatus Vogelbacteria bacterium]
MEIPNKKLRKQIVELIHKGGSPHIGSALSMVEMISAVFSSMDIEKIKHRAPDRDRFIQSKGHGVAALYAVMARHGLISPEALATFHSNGSLLAGHASHFVPFIEHSTGALGHGLSVALGAALGLRSIECQGRVFVLLGDGELHEGSNWEAIMLAGHLGMENLTALVDNNGLDQMGKLNACCGIEPLVEKFKSFGWNAVRLNGHDETAISKTISDNKRRGKPLAIICNTVKGKGVSFMEGEAVWHYRTPRDADYETALTELS